MGQVANYRAWYQDHWVESEARHKYILSSFEICLPNRKKKNGNEKVIPQTGYVTSSVVCVESVQAGCNS